ncbi:hypothetical protein [Fluviispira sanaruensis]|uniref:Uncharacterized protein n=1 Tax=Fluviispira sanaruensis TaxID=2493639 RepID=A0A4P2VHA9_FLUSA|nr:hypothetical protein [Fluviispira sanaruensis]BBH52343.1 hypothetical protein JCM31447_07840 [Fluviispira sanaruensis]
MSKYYLYFILTLLFFYPAYSYSNESNYSEEFSNNNKSSIRIDLLFGAGYMMWVCKDSGKSCSSSFTITNGTVVDVEKNDIFYIGIHSLPQICDFYRVIKSHSLSVISYWGTVFKPHFTIYGDDVIQFLNREKTYNLVSGCPKFMRKYYEK